VAAMKQVGVREFRDHATLYLSGSDPIAITRNGHIIGVYTPFKRDQERLRRAVDKLEKTVNQILEETGMTEDELERQPHPVSS
jgi:hypothetical protein